VCLFEGDVDSEGRWDWETELSARDLSCSDQLKTPSPDDPGLPLPVRTVLSACAPNDIRRAKGALGLLLLGPSSSSIALSSIDSEPAVDTLDRRLGNGNGDGCEGDVPDRPRVEIDMRRL
jgi:hypothetical protein